MSEPYTNREQATNASEELLVDRGLPLVAMGGAVLGAVVGVVAGAEVRTAFPVMCGTLGTILGSGGAAWAWCLLANLWGNAFVGYETGHARVEQLTPTPSAK